VWILILGILMGSRVQWQIKVCTGLQRRDRPKGSSGGSRQQHGRARAEIQATEQASKRERERGKDGRGGCASSGDARGLYISRSSGTGPVHARSPIRRTPNPGGVGPGSPSVLADDEKLTTSLYLVCSMHFPTPAKPRDIIGGNGFRYRCLMSRLFLFCQGL
jgi:hypothetical protein